MEHPAGEEDDGSLRVDFDRRLKLEFHGTQITSDAGLLAYRELDDALGLTDLADSVLSECRRGKNTHHLLSRLLRQSVFGRRAGYEDVIDARDAPSNAGHEPENGPNWAIIAPQQQRWRYCDRQNGFKAPGRKLPSGRSSRKRRLFMETPV